MFRKSVLRKATTIDEGARFKIWLQQADFDLKAANSSKDSGFYEWACFQSEQAVEKGLKAILVNAGWRPPKMHKLAVLIHYCNDANRKFRETKFEFRDLEASTFVSRYPFLIPGENLSPHEFITLENATKCIEQASSMLQKIRQLLQE